MSALPRHPTETEPTEESLPTGPHVDEARNTAGILAVLIGIPGSMFVSALTISLLRSGSYNTGSGISWMVGSAVGLAFVLALGTLWAIESSRPTEIKP